LRGGSDGDVPGDDGKDEEMNILIIGNGFDLAHGLKTSYYDFLQWAYEKGEMGNYRGFDLEAYWKNICKGVQTRCLSVVEDGMVIKDIPNPDYVEVTNEPDFAKILFEKKSESWIDLENNLAQVIRNFPENWVKRSSGFAYDEFRTLFDDFLVAKFEKYIARVVNHADVQKRLSVQNADLVLSFNYSSTFERIYKAENSKAQICYINGSVTDDNTSQHIVFGCDEYNEENSELSHFNKVYQRADKSCDRQYVEWLKYNDKVAYNIYIVDHSLGKTDHDILKPFVINENNNVTVFYHSPESKHKLIHHMIEMVGTEFMNSHSINFLPISALDIAQSGYAINRDQPQRKRRKRSLESPYEYND
jgi:hypothetical protein